ncbi:hypothetical protein ACFL5O_11695, partial [Myxococcota bacterium]
MLGPPDRRRVFGAGLLTTSALLAVGFGVESARIRSLSRGRLYDRSAAIPPNQVGLVLGCA